MHGEEILLITGNHRPTVGVLQLAGFTLIELVIVIIVLGIMAAVAGVLSPRGKVEILGTGTANARAPDGAITPVLIISELPHRFSSVLDLIESVDIPRPQFEIAVKFIETDIDDQSAYGFSWPTRITATVADYTADNASASGNGSAARTPAAEYPIPDGKIWQFGTLSIDQVSGFLEALNQNGRAHLLSDPRVTVLENHQAQMKVTTTYPIQTLSRFSEGTIIQDIVEYQDLEIGITLTVVPRLNDDGRITLKVEPVVEEITGFTGVPGNERPITANRKVATSVRVADGETLIIGGLVRETDFTTESSVLLLGDIPILGALFKHKKVEKKKTDLLIFITPRILPG
jgi:prepilin-type N-terminal cleavage/methylation domain-containing protein